VGGGNSLKINNLNSYTQVLDNGFGAVQIESILDYSKNNQYFSSNNLVSSAIDNLPNGVKYVILAYKNNSNNSFTFEKDEIFTVGRRSEIKLNVNQNYTLVIVSTGTQNIPEIIGKNYFSSARFWVDRSDPNVKILYQKIDDFKPNGNIKENVINVKLKNKTSSVSVILDASDIMGGGFGGKKIISVRNAKLIYTRPKQVEMRISDSQQMVSPESAKAEVNINFPSREINNVIAHSSFVDNLVIERNTDITFSADIKIEGLS